MSKDIHIIPPSPWMGHLVVLLKPLPRASIPSIQPTKMGETVDLTFCVRAETDKSSRQTLPSSGAPVIEMPHAIDSPEGATVHDREF